MVLWCCADKIPMFCSQNTTKKPKVYRVHGIQGARYTGYTFKPDADGQSALRQQQKKSWKGLIPTIRYGLAINEMTKIKYILYPDELQGTIWECLNQNATGPVSWKKIILQPKQRELDIFTQTSATPKCFLQINPHMGEVHSNIDIYKG